MRIGKVLVMFFSVTALVVVSLLGLRAWRSRGAVTDQAERAFNRVSPTKRRGSGPTHIIVFLDYRDERSKNLYLSVDSLLRRDSSHISIAVVSLPQEQRFDRSFEAAALAECASQEGKFFAVIDSLLHAPNEAPLNDPTQLANAVGMPNPTRFRTCLTSDWVSAELLRNAELADAANISVSSVMITRGRYIRRIPTVAWLREVVGLPGEFVRSH